MIGGEGRNRTDDAAFAEPCLTTWLPRHRDDEVKFVSRANQVKFRGELLHEPANPNSLRRFQSSSGLKIPTGVMMPVINSAGVTSKPGLRAPLVGFATRTNSRLPREFFPHAPSTSLSLRSSIGIFKPDFRFQSIVERGIAT